MPQLSLAGLKGLPDCSRQQAEGCNKLISLQSDGSIQLHGQADIVGSSAVEEQA